MSRQLYAILRGVVRLPSASSSARHHARLTIFLISIVVVAFNCRWVFRDFEMYLSPIELWLVLRDSAGTGACFSASLWPDGLASDQLQVPVIFLGICPLFLLASYYFRDIPSKAFPHIIDDARASDVFLNLGVQLIPKP